MSATNLATSHHDDAPTGPTFFTNNADGHQAVTPYGDQFRLQKQLDSVLKGIKSSAVQAAIRSVFTDLMRQRDVLRIVEMNASEGGPLAVSLALFSLIENESKALIRFIETCIPQIKSIKGPLRQVLDGTSFALRHELKRVFGHELAGINQKLKTNQVRTDVMRAHGLLSNCFQQSLIALAQVFDPSLSADRLFDDYRDRFEQSTVLLRDLSRLMGMARQAGERQDQATSNLLLGDLKAFCHGTMHYLMYKDCDEFEDITREVISSYGSVRHGFILHCFSTYLEALINQVQMRAVLNERAPERQEPKARKKR
jgi:hypothetical protein